MKIAVVDGMGGGMGAQIVQGLVKGIGEKAEIWALGTNAMATSSMIKAGANKGATGENAIKVSIKEVDIIIGPLGIIMPNSMMGEITPFISETIASSKCRKILIPVNQAHVELVGYESKPLGELIKETIKIVLA
ncbi:protein of unknown function [Desulfonispora thiosulfatigenes DSM 11270]|uniref:DUF3842 family protein n=1 Tax=Desulfonispora thiosulfatigenes DSM 11270 TaxID=656914 RepID=A0A1W1VH74_DESTI|nr:DUF3842 family protein [Desulfonispora thiosulfatigenes]SMB92666.1 protein of unknown function [Desulfonispora thiosulfatigenes DSM 11270]